MALKKLAHDMYGLPVYEAADGKEYAVGTEAQAQKAAVAGARDSLWAFRASYISAFLDLPSHVSLDKVAKAIEIMQEKLSEDAGPIIELLLGSKIDGFLDRAVRNDGMAHFLNTYDDEQYDSSTIKGLPKGKLAFRLG